MEATAGTETLAALGDDWGLGMAGIVATDLAVRAGDLDTAVAHAEPALRALQSCGEVWGSEQLTARLSLIAERGRDYPLAIERARDARRMAQRAGITEAANYQQARLGVLAFAMGANADAAGHFTGLLTDPAVRATPESRCLAHAGLATVATDPITADHHRMKAEQLRSQLGAVAYVEASLTTRKDPACSGEAPLLRRAGRRAGRRPWAPRRSRSACPGLAFP